jgi:surface antigen
MNMNAFVVSSGQSGQSAIDSVASSLPKDGPPGTPPTSPGKDTASTKQQSGGVLDSPSSAQQRNARLQEAHKTILATAVYAGVDLPPARTHAEWSKNAVTVYNKLVEISTYHAPAAVEANKFLDKMTALGKPDGLNFGLKQSNGEPLNKGVAQSEFAKSLSHAVTPKEPKKDSEPLWENKGAGAKQLRGEEWTASRQARPPISAEIKQWLQKPESPSAESAERPKLAAQASTTTDPEAQAKAFMDKVIPPGAKTVSASQLQEAIDKGLLSPDEKTVANKMMSWMKGDSQVPVEAVMQRLPAMFKEPLW